MKPICMYSQKPVQAYLPEYNADCTHTICWLSTSVLISNLSADIIRHVHPWSSYRCFVRAQATRCQAGCNIKQHALTLNGRTPAAKATTKRLPLTAFPLFSASYMTPAPSWKEIATTLPWTRGRPLERKCSKAAALAKWAQAESHWGWSDAGGHCAPARKSWWGFPFRKGTWRVNMGSEGLEIKL